jgi:ketosteroid isomerase-like protein
MDQLVLRSATDLITDLFSIIDGEEWERLPTVFTTDCVYLRPGYEPYEGLDRLVQFYRDERIIGEGRHEVEFVVSDIGVAACWGRFRGRSRTGEPLDEAFADTYQIRAGKIAHRRTFFYRAAI